MAKKDEGSILLKIGLKTDSAEQADDREHIWFKLLEFDGERFKGQLIQEPYDVSHMHGAEPAASCAPRPRRGKLRAPCVFLHGCGIFRKP